MEKINDFKFLSDKLLQYRKEKGLSQEELGNKIGVSRQAVSKWESGEITPDFNNLVLLCKVLDKRLDELLDGADDILYDMNKTKNIKKVINFKKIKRIIIYLLFIIILTIIISVIYKCHILYKINMAVDNQKNLNNYYYRYTDYRTNNNELTKLHTIELYYKDGIYKRILKVENEIQQIIWANVNTREGYNIDLQDNTYSRIKEDTLSYYGNENGIYELRASAIECENVFEYIVTSFPFYKKINSGKYHYVIDFKTAVGFEETISINKETGLPEKIQRKKDNINEYNQYEYNFNSVTDEDLQKPNLEEYVEIINERA